MRGGVDVGRVHIAAQQTDGPAPPRQARALTRTVQPCCMHHLAPDAHAQQATACLWCHAALLARDECSTSWEICSPPERPSMSPLSLQDLHKHSGGRLLCQDSAGHASEHMKGLNQSRGCALTWRTCQ